MKTPFSRALLAITGATLLAIPAHAAADFSDFAGKYKGTYRLDVTGAIAAGNITTTVKVPRHGRSATILLKGTIFATGIPISVNGKVRMKSNGRLKANSPLMGYISPVATKPSRYRGRKNSFKFKLTTQPDATLFGASFFSKMDYTLRFNRDSLSLNGSGVVTTSLVPLTIKIKGKR